jgi:nucleotide-binding universal stress UspA family protein
MTPISQPIPDANPEAGAHLATSDLHLPRIVVGTDFSAPATVALKTAIAIGRIYGSEILLVHAVTPFMSDREQEPTTPNAFHAALEGAKTEMKWLVANEPTLRGLQHSNTVCFAEADDLVDQVARAEKASLIVVGSNASSGLQRLTLGSVSESILRKAPWPVLIVGPRCHAEAEPFRSIVFATDLKTTGLRAAQYAAALAERGHGRLTLLHVAPPTIPTTDAPDTTQAYLEEELRSLLPADVTSFCQPKVRVEYGAPSEIIPVVAESEAASLIVVGLPHIPPMDVPSPWSTLTNVIRESRCGVLGVRSHLE